MPLDKAFSKVETKSSLDTATVSRIYTVLSGLFKACVKHDILLKNPCTNAEKPEQKEKTAVFLDNLQLSLFQSALETLNNANIRMGLLLCLWLGLRSGEARGLQWHNVCFATNTVKIKTAANETKSGLALGKPKTKRSDRVLPISPELRRILLEHKARQEENIALCGSAYDSTLNLVCPNTTGGILNTDMLNNAVKKIASNNPSLPPKLHTHSLRHTFCTLLIASDIDVVTVAALAGDSVKTIITTYAHSIKAREVQAMQTITALFDNPQQLL